MPYTTEELLDIGRREYERGAVLEMFDELRHPGAAPPPPPTDVAAQAADTQGREREVRGFYERNGLLSQPASLRHYRAAPLPEYLAPLAWLGVTDDLTSAARPHEDATTYVPEPRPDLPYFHRANAIDPRLGIIHEGVHSQQLALAWMDARPARRHFYDSSANEGIAFYNEEMMLACGLLNDHPAAYLIGRNLMRLRALRVEVDIALATGRADIEEAAETLARRIPLDPTTAGQEAAFFAATPGQGMSYQIGKTQVMRLVAAARERQGSRFRLRDLHDYLWVNGNVPISLLRWEYLGLRDDIGRADRLARTASEQPA